MRFRRLLVTINLNIRCPLPDLVDEVGAAGHDALALRHAGGDDQPGGVEWLCAYRPRFESLRLDVQPYDRFTIAATHHGLPWNDDAGHGRAAFGHNGDRLTDAEIRWRVRNGEMDERGMVLQGSAEATKGKRHGLSAGSNRRRVAKRSRVDRAVDQRFDPKRLRIDDLSWHDFGHGDHAIGRRAEKLRFSSCVADRLATKPQARKFRFDIHDLASRHGVAFGERAQSPKFRFSDCDQLLDLTGFFGDCRTVGERQIRIDLDQNIALADGLADARDPAFQRDDASTVDALHHTGSVRITDHAADQVDCRPYNFRLGSSGADLQKALRRLCHKRRAVGQPARCIAHCSARVSSRGAAGTIMVITTYHNEHDENDGCGSARCYGRDETTAAMQVTKHNTETECDQDQHNRMSDWPRDR